MAHPVYLDESLCLRELSLGQLLDGAVILLVAKVGRGTVRRTEEPYRSSLSTSAQAEVRTRAVLPRGHCAEHQTPGSIPQPVNDATATYHCIGTAQVSTD
jgi:hypothetical protein